MATPTFTAAGAKATTAAKLDKSVFAVEIKNHELVKQAYTMYLANGRENLAVVKTRGLVSGGGRKPWKQKGTGRARFGSSRNPIWRGGGIVFGPTGEENYSKSMNVKAKRTAIRQALTMAATADKVSVIEAFEVKDGKSATAAKLLAKLETKGRTVIVLDTKNEAVLQATRNIQKVEVVLADRLNVFTILNANKIVITNKSLEVINAWLGGKA